MIYARLFSQRIGHTFDKDTIRVTAITGTAATEIGGQTTAMEYGYMKQDKAPKLEQIKEHANTRLNIIDEISFAGYDTVLTKVSSRLQGFTQCTDHVYGNHAMCFLGDFCQLQNIGGECIYEREQGIYWEQALNCMVELEGTHRYKDCPVLKRIMPQIRNEGMSEEIREILNGRVIDGKKICMPTTCGNNLPIEVW